MVPDTAGVLHPVTSPVPVGVFPIVGPSNKVAQVSIGGSSLGLSIDGLMTGANGKIQPIEESDPPLLAGLSKEDSAKAAKVIGLPKPSSGAPHYQVRDGVSVQVSATASGVKTTYAVASASAAQGVGAKSLVERITLPAGWSKRQGERVIELIDANGTVQGWWQGGPVSDANAPGALSSASMKLIDVTNGVASAEVVLDEAWLNDPKRVFPISIDPGVMKTPLECCGGDTTVDSHDSGIDGNGASFWDSPELLMGFNPHNGRVHRPLITFNLSDLGGYDVAGGHMYLYQHSAVTCTPMPFTVSRNVKPWTPEISWAQINDSFTTGEFATTTESGFGPGCPPGSGGYVGIDITPMASRWIQDGAPNYGVSIQAGNETDHSYWKRFSSWEGGSSPLLFLSLGHRPGQASPQWPDDEKVLAAMTPRLTTLRAPDGDQDDPYYRFQVTTGAESTSPLVADSGWIPDPSFEVPAGALVDGQNYFWRVYTADMKPRPDWMSEETYRQHLWNNPVFVTTPDWVRQFRIDMISGDITPNPNPTAPKPERFGTPETSGYAEDPVETSSGNFVHSEGDLSFAPGIFALGYARTYNARDVLGSTLGQGWSGSYQSRLSVQSDASVILREDDGRQRHFVANPDGSFVRPPEADFDLVRNGVGRYELVSDDGMIQRFDGAGRLESATFWDGQSITIARNSLGDVTSVQSSASSVGAAGPSMAFTYAPAGPSRRLSSITTIDPLGNATIFGFNALGQQTTITDALGAVTTTAFDPDGNLTSTTSPTGLITRFAYDPVGNQIKMIDPRGGVSRTLYSPRGEVLEEHDPSGAMTSFAYDKMGRLIKAIDANKGVSSFTYDQRGNRTSMTAQNGARTTYSYDLSDRLIATTDPLGRIMTSSYDPRGFLASQVDPTGRSETRSYDPAGQLLSQVFTHGETTQTATFTYDTAGRRETMVDATGTTRYSYDANGRTLATTYPDGSVVGATYDLAGNRTSLAYPDGSMASFAYDKANRLAGLTMAPSPQGAGTAGAAGAADDEPDNDGDDDQTGDADGDSDDNETDDADDGPANGPASVTYTHDLEGRLTHEAFSHGSSDDSDDPTSRSYDYTKDLMTRFTQIDKSDSKITTLTHDPMGRILTETTNGETITYKYDASGQLLSIKATQPMAQGVKAITSVYDNVGNRVSQTLDKKQTTYTYDLASQLLSLQEAKKQTTFTYDQDGRLVNETSPNESTTRTYNARGQLVKRDITGDDEDHASFAYTYNGDGTLTTLVSPTTDDDEGDESDDDETVADPGGVNRFIWDEATWVPEIISWNRNGQNTNLAYGYGRALAMSKKQTSIFIKDVYGSALTTGNHDDLLAAQSFDPWGNPSGGEGEIRSHVGFGYRGELHIGTDIFLRARNYTPEIARFTTKDPLSGVDGEVTVANPYPYAANDPLNQIDPLGLSPMTDDDLGEVIWSPRAVRSPFVSQTPVINGAPFFGGSPFVNGAPSAQAAANSWLRRYFPTPASTLAADPIAYQTHQPTSSKKCGTFDFGCKAKKAVDWGGGVLDTVVVGGGEIIRNPGAASIDAWKADHNFWVGFANATFGTSYKGYSGKGQNWSRNIGSATYWLESVLWPGGKAVGRWRTGKEFSVGSNGARLAPFGNRGPGRVHKPHYHRRRPDPARPGHSLPGQTIRRHRPLDTHLSDKSFWDRF